MHTNKHFVVSLAEVMNTELIWKYREEENKCEELFNTSRASFVSQDKFLIWIG